MRADAKVVGLHQQLRRVLWRLPAAGQPSYDASPALEVTASCVQQSAPSYKRMRESLEVISSCVEYPGSHCIPVILRPLAVFPRLFFTSAYEHACQHQASASARVESAPCCLG